MCRSTKPRKYRLVGKAIWTDHRTQGEVGEKGDAVSFQQKIQRMYKTEELTHRDPI